LDVDEDRTQSVPTIRLWGIDETGRRVVVKLDHIMPYFYLVPSESQTAESVAEEFDRNLSRFPEALKAEIETRKLLGCPRRVVKITCKSSDVVAQYAREIPKLLGSTTSYEGDLRLSARYFTDTDLTPCAWHECEAQDSERRDLIVDRVLKANTMPVCADSCEPPKMRVLSFSLLTAAEGGSARADRDPVRAIGIARDGGVAETYVSSVDSDSNCIKQFVSQVKQYDPDLIVGFESNKTDWPYITQRGKTNRIGLELGRDRSIPHTSVYGHTSVAGRANVDLFEIAAGIPEIKVKNVENLAGFLRVPSAGKLRTIEEFERYRMWMDEVGREELLAQLKAKAQALSEISDAALTFPMQLAALTKLPLDHVMTAAVGFRVDSYLMRQAHLCDELIPGRSEVPYVTYQGALVLEPKTGVHNNVAVLDFASMYPQLMIAHNLSPDTLLKPSDDLPEDVVFTVPGIGHRFRQRPDGLFRIALTNLIEQRAQLKKDLEHVAEGSVRFRVLKERERALKVITNACYGYAGWVGARWYVREVAESATALGRDAITKTIAHAESLGLNVIYGDTDSIFVADEADKIDALKSWTQKVLGLEIKVDKRYVRVLFTEAMKRYAGLLPDGSIDIVGLEVVRGDWSDIARQVQERVLARVLLDQSVEKAIDDVKSIIRQLRRGEVPLSRLTIRKTLTKPLENYTVRTPHVEVAKKLLREGWDIAVGDKVSYVITKGRGRLFEKAKPMVKARPDDVDVDFYVESQIKPAAMRVLERFGVDAAQLDA